MTSEAIDARAAVLPGNPRWLVSVIYALGATAAVGWAAWPGMMSYDSVFAFQESRVGIQTMVWPPMHAYLFFLSHSLGAQSWGLFLLQTFLLFLGAGLAVNLLVTRRAWALAGLALFTFSIVWFPELMGSLVVQWRDTATGAFFLAGVAAWLMAARRRSRLGLGVAALAFGIALSLRYNAVLLAAPLAGLMVAAPFLNAPTTRSTRGLAAAVLAVAFTLAWASTVVRLPDFRPLPNPKSFAATQEFDLLGISACADRNYLPPAMSGGAPITPHQIRQAYDPRHLNLAFRPIPGVPRLIDVSGLRETSAIWKVAVREAFGCYLAHRSAVFVQQMGLARADVYQPGYFVIDPNPYGLAAANPRMLTRLAQYTRAQAPAFWARPFLLYLLAGAATALLWLRRTRGRSLYLALFAGAAAYAGALFVVGPAADARYIFPSNIVCALLIAAGLPRLLEARRRNA